MDSNFIKIVLAIALVAFAIHLLRKLFKLPAIGALCLFSGGVKKGKTTVAVGVSYYGEYTSRHRKWKFKKFFQKLFKLPFDEEPLLYSNIPLAVPYVPVTEDLLLRKKRFNYGSVVYLCEASLIADSMMIRDMDLNERLLYFHKLIGHELKGGCLIYDTQACGDCHFSVKRCLSEYFYVHRLVKWIPFFLIAYVREERYSADGSVINVNTKDVESDLKRLIIPKKTWKMFDCYCYSALTDDLPVENTVVDGKKLPDLKARKIVSFRNKGGNK